MPESQTNSIKHWLWISALVVILDQASKLIAEATLTFREPFAIMPMFNFTLVYNEGAAFSFLSDAGGWQRWFFITLSCVISIALVVWLSKLSVRQRLLTTSIAFILGGAIGNLIDRSLYGHVIDFIDVYYQHHHWPAFNIADSAIFIGTVLLIIDSFKNKHEQHTA